MKQKQKSKIFNQRKAKKVLNQFVTKRKAIDETALSEKDFQKTCIWKGIHPRMPPSKLKSTGKLYYHANDLKAIRKDPVSGALRTVKAHLKKCKKAKGRDDEKKASTLYRHTPFTDLSHIVHERYPTFLDAIRDLDDAVSTVSLFSALPTNLQDRIAAGPVRDSKMLLDDFHRFIVERKCLDRVFASIKGFYLEATILGEPVMWLLPHQFSQTIPLEADFEVMLSFLDFYRSLMRFVNFKLYKMAGLTYPTTQSEDGTEQSFQLTVLRPSRIKVADEKETADDESMASDAENEIKNKPKQIEVTKQSSRSSLFTGISFFVSRENPRIPVCLSLAACGAQNVVWDDSNQGPLSPEIEQHISHHIVDRPLEHLKDVMEKFSHREFVQPQWIFDSINAGMLLPVAPYKPGNVPPPHLSPFVEGRLTLKEDAQVNEPEYDSDDETAVKTRKTFQQFAAEVQKEKSDVVETAATVSVEKDHRLSHKEDDEKMRKRSLLSKRQRKQYDKVKEKEDKKTKKRI